MSPGCSGRSGSVVAWVQRRAAGEHRDHLGGEVGGDGLPGDAGRENASYQRLSVPAEHPQPYRSVVVFDGDQPAGVHRGDRHHADARVTERGAAEDGGQTVEQAGVGAIAGRQGADRVGASPTASR